MRAPGGVQPTPKAQRLAHPERSRRRSPCSNRRWATVRVDRRRRPAPSRSSDGHRQARFLPGVDGADASKCALVCGGESASAATSGCRRGADAGRLTRPGFSCSIANGRPPFAAGVTSYRSPRRTTFARSVARSPAGELRELDENAPACRRQHQQMRLSTRPMPVDPAICRQVFLIRQVTDLPCHQCRATSRGSAAGMPSPSRSFRSAISQCRCTGACCSNDAATAGCAR